VGTGVISRLGRDADHSPPSDAEVKNGFSHTSTPTYTPFLHGWGDLYLLLHGVTFHKNALLMLTAQRTVNIAYGFDVMGDKFLNKSLIAWISVALCVVATVSCFAQGLEKIILFIVLGCNRKKHELLARENCRAYRLARERTAGHIFWLERTAGHIFWLERTAGHIFWLERTAGHIFWL
jgi:hypothetical protein